MIIVVMLVIRLPVTTLSFFLGFPLVSIDDGNKLPWLSSVFLLHVARSLVVVSSFLFVLHTAIAILIFALMTMALLDSLCVRAVAVIRIAYLENCFLPAGRVMPAAMILSILPHLAATLNPKP